MTQKEEKGEPAAGAAADPSAGPAAAPPPPRPDVSEAEAERIAAMFLSLGGIFPKLAQARREREPLCEPGWYQNSIQY